MAWTIFRPEGIKTQLRQVRHEDYTNKVRNCTPRDRDMVKRKKMVDKLHIARTEQICVSDRIDASFGI